jgi:hypothetical protein
MAEEYEKEVCEECGSENILDTIFAGKIIKLCENCASMNGAVILKKPTIEQINKAEHGTSLTDRVKAWRKDRGRQPREANLDTLRRRKHELEHEKEKEKQEIIKKEIEELGRIIDFRSRDITISDIRKMHELKSKSRLEPTLKIKPEPKLFADKQKTELEIDEFMQEVKKIGEEEKFEQEIGLGIPRPLESIDPEDYEENPKESSDNEI